MDREKILKILNEEILKQVKTTKVGAITRQNTRYGIEKVSHSYDSLTISEFIEFCKIDTLENKEQITEEMADTLREMLASYIDVRRIFETGEIPMFEASEEYDKKRNELITMSEYIEKELDSYHILIKSDENILEELLELQVEKEAPKKIKTLTQGPRKR